MTKALTFCKIWMLWLILVLPIHGMSQLTFTNVAGTGSDASNIPYSKDGGASFADYDLDGDLDIAINTSDNNAARRSYLLRNDNGVYTDVTNAIAPDLKANGVTERSVAWGDCNNDGYPDLLVNSNLRLKILLNDGGASFTTLLEFTAMTDGMNTEGAGWIDYDMDGDLDFFVENHNFGVDVFENNGATPSPTFTQVTINAIGAAGTGAGGLGLPEGGSTTGDYGTSSDVNADGYPDILVRRQNSGSNTGADLNPHDVFINDGDGTFTANTTVAEQVNNSNKGGVISGDFDGDGDFDILWTSASTSGNRSVIYENTGLNSMVFALVANPFFLENGGAETATDFDGCAIGDVDNDGDLDLFMTQNSGASRLYLNLSSGPGDFNFRQVGPTWVPGAAVNYGINVSGNGEGCVFADFDNDGDVDLYVNKAGQNQLWENDYIGSATESAALFQNNYLRVVPFVDLGGGNARPALNATVRFLDCDGNVVSGIREIGAGGAGHGSQTSPWLLFGLKNGPDASYTVEVQFTRDGTTPVIVKKAVIPSELSPFSLGTSTLALEQTIVIIDSDTDDITSCPEICADGMDNDGDGLIDCDDPECALQGNGYDWYFGQNASLDFEFASGPVQGPTSVMNAEEGCAQWSDPSGKMLFYTNGVAIYNRFHTAMPNGSGLVGDPSATQSGVIVEDPGNPNRYYVFYIDTSPFQARYCVVDMSLDGGKGDVVAGLKNIFIQSLTSEKIAAWPHSNGTDIWIVMSDVNNLYSYQLTATGLSPVVTSSATSSGRRFGYMKFSPAGDRLGVACYPLSGSETVQLYDFDNATGAFSNKVEWNQVKPYGLEFSPDGKMLYVTDMGWGATGSLHQYVLNGNLTGADILASRTTLLSAAYMHTALQTGPDGKIYMATAITGNNPRNGLAVVNDPNTQGMGANAVADQITFTGGAMSRSGLPNIPAYQLKSEPVVTYVDAADTCLANGTIQLSGYAAGSSGYQWLLDGVAIAGATSDTYTPTEYGAYQLVSSFVCASDTSEVLTIHLDSDGDCHADYYDLDDDNDGILDTEEGSCSVTADYSNGGTRVFGDDLTFSSDIIMDLPNYDPVLEFVSARFGLWDTYDYEDNFRSVDGTLGNQGVWLVDNAAQSGIISSVRLNFGAPLETPLVFEVGDLDSSGEQITFITDNGSDVNISNLQSLIFSPTTNVLKTYTNDGNSSVGHTNNSGSAAITIEAGVTSVLLEMLVDVNGSIGISIYNGCTAIDTDNDGISDYLDTDSDGDGCLDTIEAGYTDADEDGEVDGTGYLTDGTVDGSDGYMGTHPYVTDAVVNSCEDNDEDGIPDGADLDDDNDGLFDTEECGDLTNSITSGNNSTNLFGVYQRAGNDLIDFEVTSDYNAVRLASTSGLQLRWDQDADPTVALDLILEEPQLGSLESVTVGNGAPGVTVGTQRAFQEITMTWSGGGTAVLYDPLDEVTGRVTGDVLVSGDVIVINNGTTYSLSSTEWSLSIDMASVTTFPTTIFYSSDASINPNMAYNREGCMFSAFVSCPDTDGDGIPDNLDTDSDGDGCLDTIEAGYTDADEDGEVDGTGYAADGTVLGSDGYSGTDPIVTDFNYVAASCDSDGDGINPNVDLDDDNDGIPDIAEGCGSTLLTPNFISTDAIDHGSAFNDETEVANGIINNIGGNGTDGYVFNTDAGAGGIFNPTFNFEFTVDEGHYFNTFEMYGTVGSLVAEQCKAYAIVIRQAVGGSIVFSGQASTPSTLANGTPLSLNVELLPGDYILTFTDLDTPLSNREFSEVRFTGTACILDTDGDGVSDHLDLDSDNDGIYDLVEAGHGEDDIGNDGIIDGLPAAFGNNGLYDELEDAPDSGILDQPTADSDGDGNIDSIELDSDNDGCNDVIEAGYLDQNGDGLLGDD